MKREDRSTMLTYGSMVFGGFGPVTPWYTELMKQAEEVSAWIMARCQRDALCVGWHRCGDLRACGRGQHRAA